MYRTFRQGQHGCCRSDELPSVELPSCQRMPIFGLGTWQARDEDVRAAVESALRGGYRLVDTAFSYSNERVVGDVLREFFGRGELQRSHVFVTTKLPGIFMTSAERVRAGVELSLAALQLEYVDLLLIHSPVAFRFIDEKTLFPTDKKGRILAEDCDHVLVWKTLEEFVAAGRVRSLGLSNFNEAQIDNIQKHCTFPVCNVQVECHAYLQQRALRDFCRRRRIAFTAYAPIGSPAHAHGKGDLLLRDPVVREIAQRHASSPAQVLLNFLVREGVAVVPKSTNPERIDENRRMFDVQLSDQDIRQLRQLDRNLRYFRFENCKDCPNYPFTDDK